MFMVFEMGDGSSRRRWKVKECLLSLSPISWQEGWKKKEKKKMWIQFVERFASLSPKWEEKRKEKKKKCLKTHLKIVPDGWKWASFCSLSISSNFEERRRENREQEEGEGKELYLLLPSSAHTWNFFLAILVHGFKKMERMICWCWLNWKEERREKVEWVKNWLFNSKWNFSLHHQHQLYFSFRIYFFPLSMSNNLLVTRCVRLETLTYVVEWKGEMKHVSCCQYMHQNVEFNPKMNQSLRCKKFFLWFKRETDFVRNQVAAVMMINMAKNGY